MTTQPVSQTPPVPALPPARIVVPRWFYSAVALAFLVLTVIGFKDFYLRGQAYPGRPIAPPIRGVVIAHGLAMSAWLLLFVVQPLLIARRNHKIHMKLGYLSAVLAAVIFCLGFVVAVHAARIAPPDLQIFGLTPKPFLTVPFIAMVMFGAFVGIGVWKRNRPEVHRPMMMLASLSAISASFGRITALNDLYAGTVIETIFGAFFTTLVMGLIVYLAHWAFTKKWDKAMGLGLAALTVAFVLSVRVAHTQAWDSFASILVPAAAQAPAAP